MRINFKYNLLAIIISIIVSFVFSTPDLIGYLKSGGDKLYSGNSYVWDPWDVNVYVSAIRYSQEFGWKYQNLYTTERFENNVVLYPVYSLMGILFNKTNPFIIYNLSAFFLTILLVYSIYKTLCLFTNNKVVALISATISSFAGGFGWLMWAFNISTPDVSITPFMMANVFQRPHTALSLTFYLLSLGLFYKSLNKKDFKYLILPLSFAILAGLIYPYLLLSYSLILLAFTGAISFKEKRYGLILKTIKYLLILAVLEFSYSAYILKVKGLEDVITPSLKTPNLLFLLLGVGLFSIPLYFQFKKVKTDRAFLFFYIWIFVHLALTYTPLGFARYYFLGIFVPMSFLMGMFLYNLRLKSKWIIGLFFVIFSSLSSALLIFYRIFTVINTNSPSYWHQSDIKAINFMTGTLKNNDRIISTYPFANFIPTLKPVYVYFGHYYQTPLSSEKIRYLEDFYNNKMSEENALSFLKKEGISYIIWRNEKEKWNDFPKLPRPEYKFLKQIFKNEDYLFYSY